jgi:hypothetical protein
MTTRSGEENQDDDFKLSIHELLLRMDLATEVLAGLDELGLDTRAQVESLLARLELQVADSR